jgi:hypothetical protein
MTRRVAAALGATLLLVAACGGEDGPEPTREGAVQVVTAGDIGLCGSEHDEATAELVAAQPSATVLVLGDIAYADGKKEEFESCYAPSWGSFKDRTRPVPGNHEYNFHKDAAAYFDYFGDAAGSHGAGYYSFELGAWHVAALNSNCEAETLGGCGLDSPQGDWLRADLAANQKRCTLAFWHHPRFSAGGRHGSHSFVGPFWEALYDAGADLVLSGHDHNYQRFAPQDPSGAADPRRGIRQFVVGTGGAELYSVGPELPTTEVQGAEAYGVLHLALFDGGYDWEFKPAEGATFTDRGSGRCH